MKDLDAAARELAIKRRNLKYDLIPIDQAMELEFIEGFKAGALWHAKKAEKLVEAVRSFMNSKDEHFEALAVRDMQKALEEYEGTGE